MTTAQETGSTLFFGLPWKDNARGLLIPSHCPAASPFRFARGEKSDRRCGAAVHALNATKLEAF